MCIGLYYILFAYDIQDIMKNKILNLYFEWGSFCIYTKYNSSDLISSQAITKSGYIERSF